tara:strand:- start:487 stop:1386 length:900 start_codon:yes stop_codon:yes gene_type:complete
MVSKKRINNIIKNSKIKIFHQSRKAYNKKKVKKNIKRRKERSFRNNNKYFNLRRNSIRRRKLAKKIKVIKNNNIHKGGSVSSNFGNLFNNINSLTFEKTGRNTSKSLYEIVSSLSSAQQTPSPQNLTTDTNNKDYDENRLHFLDGIKAYKEAFKEPINALPLIYNVIYFVNTVLSCPNNIIGTGKVCMDTNYFVIPYIPMIENDVNLLTTNIEDTEEYKNLEKKWINDRKNNEYNRHLFGEDRNSKNRNWKNMLEEMINLRNSFIKTNFQMKTGSASVSGTRVAPINKPFLRVFGLPTQ